MSACVRLTCWTNHKTCLQFSKCSLIKIILVCCLDSNICYIQTLIILSSLCSCAGLFQSSGHKSSLNVAQLTNEKLELVFYMSPLSLCYPPPYPHPHPPKSDGAVEIASVHLSDCSSVRPSCYLPLNKIWCVSYSQEWGVQQYIFFGQITLNFKYKVNFKDFQTKLCTLYVFS